MLLTILQYLVRGALVVPRFFLGTIFGRLLQRASLKALRDHGLEIGLTGRVNDALNEAKLSGQFGEFHVRVNLQFKGSMLVPGERGGVFVRTELKSQVRELELETGWFAYTVLRVFSKEFAVRDRFDTGAPQFDGLFARRVADAETARALKQASEVHAAADKLFRRSWINLAKIWVGGKEGLSLGVVLNNGAPFHQRIGLNQLERVIRDVVELAKAFDRALAPALDDATRRASEALIEAAGDGRLARVEELVAEGARADYMDIEYRTALVEAISRRDCVEMVRFLLSAGARVDSADSQGRTVLHHAVYLEHETEVLRLLLDAGASVDARGFKDLTPLMMAAELGLPSLVQLLLERGADRKLKSADGDTALSLAEDAGEPGTAALLKQ